MEPKVLRCENISSYFHGSWDPRTLAEGEFADHLFNVYMKLGQTAEFRMTMRQFLAYSSANSDLEPMYLFESEIPKVMMASIQVSLFSCCRAISRNSLSC